MKKTTLAMSAAVLAMAGTAVYAAAPGQNADMTRAQVTAKAGEMWAKMDVNSDGVINQADREARRTQRFDQMDTNKDGSISRAEFNAAHPADGSGHHRMHGQNMGHEGMKGHDQMGGGRMGHGHRDGGMKMGKMMLQMADANKDGSVTRAEFDAALARHLDQVDANKDGTITAAERRAAHADMMKQHSAHHPATPRPAGQ